MPPQERATPQFHSSDRAKDELWLANLLILPAYFFSIAIIVEHISRMKPLDDVPNPLWTVLYCVLVIPSLLPFFRRTHFHGIKGRLILLVVSGCGLAVEYIVWLRIDNFSWEDGRFRTILVAFLMLFFYILIVNVRNLGYGRFLAQLLLPVLIAFVVYISDFLDLHLFAIAVGVLLAMLFADGPVRFWQRQRNRVLRFTARIRHDRIRRHMSPTIPPSHWWSRLRYALPRYQLFTSPATKAGIALLFGLFGIPTIEIIRRYGTDYRLWKWEWNDTWELAKLSSLYGFVLSFLYLMFWFFSHRPKHIVYPFKVFGDEQGQLNPLANLITYSFAEQTQRISELMSLRYVENVNATADMTFSMVVTSGQQDEFMQKLEAFGDVEMMENVRFRPGRLFSAIVAILALTQVRGFVQRRQDKSVQVWIEYSTRFGRTVSVRAVIPAVNSFIEVDEYAVQAMTKELALKLVAALGKEAHLASSWESLDHFIDGLDATRRQHWWQAIIKYRQAIQIEESFRGEFGRGYYHLGAALVFQGELREGLSNLNIADQNGPPLAETQYMLALTLYYLYGDTLDSDKERFHEIKKRCELALRIRPDFPEARHLLGTLYFQRGRRLHKKRSSKLLEHADLAPTVIPQIQEEFLRRFNAAAIDNRLYHPSEPIDIELHDIEKCYKQSVKHLGKAMQRYDGRLKALTKQRDTSPQAFSQQYRIMRDRLSATHHLADALRSLRRYGEALTFYRDVQAGIPGHIRTLVDMARVYCLTQNWQKAHDFLRLGLFMQRLPLSSAWHPETNTCMGWIYAGGIQTENWSEAQRLQQLVKAMGHLDYGLYTAPSRAQCWEQFDWLRTLKLAALKIDKEIFAHGRNIKDDVKATNDSIAIYKNINKRTINNAFVIQALRWLAWRMDSYDLNVNCTDSDEQGKSGIQKYNNLVRFTRQRLNDPEKWYPNDGFEKIYEDYKKLRGKAGCLIQAMDGRGILGGIVSRITRIDLSKELYTLWEETHEAFIYAAKPNNEPIKFSERWTVDIYAEITLLTVRFLVESHSYEYGLYVALETIEKLEKWLTDRWREYWGQEEHYQAMKHDDETPIYTFSSKVFSYQLATLHAWCAYMKYMIDEDVETQMRIKINHKVSPIQKLNERRENDMYDNIEHHLRSALRNYRQHPLAMFTQALVYQRSHLYDDAIDWLQTLSDVIAPFDPQEHVANWETRTKRRVVRDSSGTHVSQPLNEPIQNVSFGKNIADLSILCGQNQFDSIADKSHIHMALARIFKERGDWRSCVQHLQLAVVWTPYNDLDAENFLKIARYLDRLDRLPEALSMVQEARKRIEKLEEQLWTHIQRHYPPVLELIILTRCEDEHEAIYLADKAVEIMKLDDMHTVLDEYELRIKNIMDSYENPDRRSSDEPRIRKVFQLDFKGANKDVIETVKRTFRMKKSYSVEDNAWARLGNCYVNEDALESLLRKLKRKIRDPFEWIHVSQFATLLSKEAFYRVRDRAEVLNKQAYNRAEMRVDFNKKMSEKTVVEISRQSIALLDALGKNATRQKIKAKLDHQLAHFYDTLGWVYHQFNIRVADGEKDSKAYLREALTYEPKLWHAHYHLARVYQAELEALWQAHHYDDAAIAEHAPCVRELLSNVSHHWRYAHEFDTEQRSYHRLARLQQRIERYRQEWEDYQSPHFKREKKSDEDKEPAN